MKIIFLIAILSLPGLTFAQLQYDGMGTGRSVRKVTKNPFQYSVNVPESKDKNLLILYLTIH